MCLREDPGRLVSRWRGRSPRSGWFGHLERAEDGALRGGGRGELHDHGLAGGEGDAVPARSSSCAGCARLSPEGGWSNRGQGLERRGVIVRVTAGFVDPVETERPLTNSSSPRSTPFSRLMQRNRLGNAPQTEELVAAPAGQGARAFG